MEGVGSEPQFRQLQGDILPYILPVQLQVVPLDYAIIFGIQTLESGFTYIVT